MRFIEYTWSEIDRRRKRFRLRPVVVVIGDAFLAVIYAYGSIFFGYAFTKDAVGLDYLNTLFVGGYNDGHFDEIGPMFWIMHTTFIPTVIVLSVILVIVFGAFVVSPVINAFARKYMGVSESYINLEVATGLTLMKTATMFTSIGTLIMVFRSLKGLFAGS